MWQDILKTAIVGTERNAFAWPARNDALGDMLTTLDANAREASLLSAAATVALYQRAGRLPNVDSQSLPAPAEMDDASCCNARAAQHLSLMLSGEFKEVLPEWLAALAAAGKRVPEEALASLLNLGKTNLALREAITKVIGKRGVWVAKQNPDWQYAIDDLDETAWETGTREPRLALLNKLRATAPARARDLVASTWQQETPEDRAAFIATFQLGLSLQDEPFLEVALDDRRKEVRKAAADLLLRLPESALVKRMIERVKPLITYKQKLLRKGEILVALPETCDKEMQRDGIEPKPPPSGVGEKSWWLQQLLSSIPPSYLLEAFVISPNQWLELLPKEWRSEMLEGLAIAATRHRNLAWCELLLGYGWKRNVTFDRISLLESLPSEKQESFLVNCLRQDNEAALNSLMLQMLFRNMRIWDIDLSRVVTEIAANLITGKTAKHDYWRNYYWRQLVVQLHPATIIDAIRLMTQWTTDSAITELWAVGRSLQVLEFRLDMLKEIKQ